MLKKIEHRIRLLLHPKKESYFALKQILGFPPKRIEYYREALLHKSSFRENASGRVLNNERLEFLGDAILDAVIADIVFKHFPDRDEGFLTNTRSKIVKRETLDKISYELGLHRIITSSTRSNSPTSHILGNALEAFIGAVYLDQGYRATKRFIEKKIIGPYIDIDEVARKEENFKSKLLEWCQKNKIKLDYRLSDNPVDEDGNATFRTIALLNGREAGTGDGYSKKESQQRASQMAYRKIRADKEFVSGLKEKSEKAK